MDHGKAEIWLGHCRSKEVRRWLEDQSCMCHRAQGTIGVGRHRAQGSIEGAGGRNRFMRVISAGGAWDPRGLDCEQALAGDHSFGDVPRRNQV